MENTIKLSRKQILDLHALSCSKWKGIIEETVPQAVQEGTLILTRKVGMGSKVVISSFNEVYMLVNVDGSRLCLISLQDGNRWNNPTKVENVSNITASEFVKMSNRDTVGDFTFQDGSNVLAPNPDSNMDTLFDVPLSLVQKGYEEADSKQKVKIGKIVPSFKVAEYIPLNPGSLGIAMSSDITGGIANVGIMDGLAVDCKRPELRGHSLIIRAEDIAEVEVFKFTSGMGNEYYSISFKKK